MRPSSPAELSQQKALWKACFGDGDAFTGLFYDRCARPEETLVVLEDGVLRAMTAVLPLALRFPGGEQGRGGYIYALCTHPDARGRGLAHELLNYADFYLRNRGNDCVILVPGEASLRRFYRTAGYDECFSHRSAPLPAFSPPEEGDAIAPAEPGAYGHIRDRLLNGRFYISYPPRLLEFQQAVSVMLGGGLYRLCLGGAEGCVAAEYSGRDRVVVKELLVPPGLEARAAGLLAGLLPAASWELRAPAWAEGLPGGEERPFAMIKWYDPRLKRIWSPERRAYLGLGFD